MIKNNELLGVMLLKKDAKRIELLDELRGLAILAMLVHHAFLDVGSVLGLDWGFAVFDYLCRFQPMFWGIFIIISGICTRLSRSCIKRGAAVLAAGLAVTLVTAGVMPLLGMGGNEIYFGILHCLGCCMIITGVLMPLIKKIPPLAGMFASALLFALTCSVSSGSLLFGAIALPSALYQHDWLAPLGFYSARFQSADYFALLPWLFMFLFGAFLGKYAADGAFPAFTYRRHAPFLALVGRNSLWVYLAHQPVIYGILFLVYFVFFKG